MGRSSFCVTQSFVMLDCSLPTAHILVKIRTSVSVKHGVVSLIARTDIK